MRQGATVHILQLATHGHAVRDAGSADLAHAAALGDVMRGGLAVDRGVDLRDPWQRERPLQAIVLLVRRRNDRLLLPDVETPLKAGDRLLMCGSRTAFTRMQWTLSHQHTLAYIKTGADQPQGWLWRRLAKLR